MILYIDDEPRYIESFVQELEYEFGEDSIQFEEKIDKAIEFFKRNSKQIKIIILDNMMPTGKTFKDKPTNEGLFTGLFFYELIRESAPNLPIIIFTNTSKEYIRADVNDDVDKIFNQIELDEDRKKALFLQKENIFPHELVEKINELMNYEGNVEILINC